MAWQYTPYTLPLVIAPVISAGLVVVAYRNRDKRGAKPLIGVLVAAILWSSADAVRLASTDETVKLLAQNVRFLGPFLVTVSVFLYAAEYTNRDQWLRPRRIAGVVAFHAVTFVLLWTNQWHHLVRAGSQLSDVGYLVLDVEWGPWYYLHATYAYLLLVGAAAMLVDKLRQSGDVRTFRGQTLTILAATVVPWGANAAYIAGVTAVDLTPIAFAVTGTMFAVGLFRYQILDLVPIARSTVVDNVDEGYMVLDTADIIVDVNEEATALLGAEKDAVIGQSLESLFADYPDLLDRFADVRDAREQVAVAFDGSRRYYDLDISPIYDRRGRFNGRVVLFRDITRREERKRQLERQKTQLERQNERLEDFAGIVSHDLRNPINVVSGRLEMARSDPDPEHFDEMERGLERMQDIIDDVLAMARQGQSVDDPEPVALRRLCEAAWENVDTDTATLAVETDQTIEADRTRLLQVFENLFRNAIDHGPADVTITVGALEDGFYVEDDGPGIPPEERDEVLQKGYSTADDGTGLGLSIVQSAVEAHGWTIAVVEGAAGGARFEITDRTGSRGAAEVGSTTALLGDGS
jgi:PAS domain S-box-containing protein